MSTDISEAPTQDAIAESLLPAQEQPTEQPVTEQPTEEVQEQPVEQQAEQQTEEQSDDWLPGEQDRIFPDDVLAKYAERYGLDEQSLSNPQIKQLVVDKINTDIFVRQQQAAQEQYQEPEAPPQPEPTQPQLTREQYFQNLDRLIQERTDPEVAKQFHSDFLKSFGVPDSEIANIPPQQAMQFTQTASKYMLNLMNTFMGDMLSARLGEQISQAFPGFGDMYERSSYAMAWDKVRNENQSYQSLPAYGTKEFSSALRAASAKIPGFDEMQFTDANGRALPMMENASRKYAMLAQIASGQNVDPKLLQQAAQSAVRRTKQAETRRNNGNLGSGQSRAASGQSASSKFQTNSDLFDEETMENYQTQHGRL